VVADKVLAPTRSAMATNSPPTTWCQANGALSTEWGGARRRMAPSAFHGGVTRVWRSRDDRATAVSPLRSQPPTTSTEHVDNAARGVKLTHRDADRQPEVASEHFTLLSCPRLYGRCYGHCFVAVSGALDRIRLSAT
jgi:hypothetical protein